MDIHSLLKAIREFEHEVINETLTNNFTNRMELENNIRALQKLELFFTTVLASETSIHKNGYEWFPETRNVIWRLKTGDFIEILTCQNNMWYFGIHQIDPSHESSLKYSKEIYFTDTAFAAMVFVVYADSLWRGTFNTIGVDGFLSRYPGPGYPGPASVYSSVGDLICSPFHIWGDD